MSMAYPDEFNKCVINVGSLGQEKATPRAEFMEEVEFLVLGIQKQKEVYTYIYGSCPAQSEHTCRNEYFFNQT